MEFIPRFDVFVYVVRPINGNSGVLFLYRFPNRLFICFGLENIVVNREMMLLECFECFLIPKAPILTRPFDSHFKSEFAFVPNGSVPNVFDGVFKVEPRPTSSRLATILDATVITGFSQALAKLAAQSFRGRRCIRFPIVRCGNQLEVRRVRRVLNPPQFNHNTEKLRFSICASVKPIYRLPMFVSKCPRDPYCRVGVEPSGIGEQLAQMVVIGSL